VKGPLFLERIDEGKGKKNSQGAFIVCNGSITRASQKTLAC
jgi:hypothetical protein